MNMLKCVMIGNDFLKCNTNPFGNIKKTLFTNALKSKFLSFEDRIIQSEYYYNVNMWPKLKLVFSKGKKYFCKFGTCICEKETLTTDSFREYSTAKPVNDTEVVSHALVTELTISVTICLMLLFLLVIVVYIYKNKPEWLQHCKTNCQQCCNRDEICYKRLDNPQNIQLTPPSTLPLDDNESGSSQEEFDQISYSNTSTPNNKPTETIPKEVISPTATVQSLELNTTSPSVSGETEFQSDLGLVPYAPSVSE